MAQGLLDMERLVGLLRPRRIGRRIVHHEVVGSTNDVAWSHLDGASCDGLVVLAEHQTGGRGRLGRVWQDARGASVLCSTLLVDGAGQFTPALLSLTAPVAAAEAIRESTGLTPSLKWPNDLLLGGRKVGGILVESRRAAGVTAYVVGIGVNCLQHVGHFANGLSASATSLDLHSALVIDRTAVAVALLGALDRWLGGPPPHDEAAVHRRWLELSSAPGSRIALRHGGRVYTGTILDLDPSAALVVQLDEGGVRLFSAADTTVADDPSSAKGPDEDAGGQRFAGTGGRP